jgi:hypothetical protein
LTSTLTGRLTTAGVAGTKYFLTNASANLSSIAAYATLDQRWLRLSAADYALEGLTTKLRVRSLILAPSPALGVTVTFGLYAVSPGASATLGGLTTGSSASVDATSATSIFLEADSGDFTFPSDGI